MITALQHGVDRLLDAVSDLLGWQKLLVGAINGYEDLR
jgi:hypothetical protein